MAAAALDFGVVDGAEQAATVKEVATTSSKL
jgi:hypothetical protein